MKFGAWGTRFGFYLTVIGTAFGLGNIWRFPYVVAENGGGAFVLLYVFIAFVVGMPLLIGELILGKITRKSIILSISDVCRESLEVNSERGMCSPFLVKKISPLIGYISIAICLSILSYFSVISGWVLHFLVQFLVALFSPAGIEPNNILGVLQNNGLLQVLLSSVHFLLVIIIVAKDVEEGIEKFVGYIMPLFGVLLIVLMVKSLSLETTESALRFLFYPDFSKLKITSLGQALGHVLFTMSIGFGMMVTFGSYLREKAYIPLTSLRVATVDSMMSIVAGMLVFPLVIVSAAGDYGPDLLFKTVPVFFDGIKGGTSFGVVFFLLLYLGSLGASVALLETVVANLKEADKMRRSHAAWSAGLISFGVALVPALSSSLLKGLNFRGQGLLELLDSALVNWLMPISALITSQFILYFLKEKVRRVEFTHEGAPSDELMYRQWIFALKWVVPTVTLIALGLQFIGFLLGF